MSSKYGQKSVKVTLIESLPESAIHSLPVSLTGLQWLLWSHRTGTSHWGGFQLRTHQWMHFTIHQVLRATVLVLTIPQSYHI